MRVFLSSTYLDLIEYRKVVTIALRKQGHDVLQMEVFGATPEEPAEVAKSEINKCDLFVGIYAYRYGAIPKGSDISITEEEYWHAKNKAKPIFCFCVDENFPWPPKMIDKEVNTVKKLSEFRNKILSEKTVDFFTTPDNLSSVIVAAIGKHVHSLQAQISIPRPPTSTLPSITYFFGREDELRVIAEAITPERRTWGVLIDGAGGIGKTALAAQAAKLASTDLFSQKIFISAKQRTFTELGQKPLTGNAPTDSIAILNELALELGEESILKLSREEKENTLLLTLTGQRVLIVLDNLETLNNDNRNRIYKFLSRLPMGNKAIVTSRRRDDIDAQIIQLDQLPEADAQKLIARLISDNPKPVEISDTEKSELYYSTSGNPLAIKWVIAQIGRRGSKLETISDAINFMKRAPEDNDPLEYIFGDLLSTLYPKEKSVLAAMTHLSYSPKVEWIAHMTEFNERTIELVWEELANRLLIIRNKNTKEYYLPSLTNQFIRNSLPKDVQTAEKNLAQYAFRIAMEFGGRRNFHGVIVLAEEWPAISASLPYFIRNDNNKLQILCEALDYFLRFSGLWDEWLWLNQQSELVALANEDYDNAGMRAYKVGLIHGYRGEGAEVLRYAKRAENNWKEAYLTAESYGVEKPFVNYLRGIGYKLEKDFSKAVDAINSSLSIWKTLAPEGIEVARALNTLGEIQVEMGEIANSSQYYSDAEKNISEALRIAERTDDKEGKVIYTGNLARLALEYKEWVKAEILASEALKLAEEIGQQDEIARENFLLATAYLQLGYGGNRGLAASRKAVEIYTRLRHKDLPEAESLLKQWRRKTGSTI